MLHRWPVIVVRLVDMVSLYEFIHSFRLGVHDGAITSIQFHPTDFNKVLTNGMDSKLMIVDVRSGKSFQVFHHPDFHTSYNWSSSSFSSDGKSKLWDVTYG
jgi:WD40 repeat protein